MKSILTQAGKYKIEQLPSPHFSERVNMDAPPAGILHTTEGGWAGSYSILHHHFAPHFMVGLNAQYHAAKRLSNLQHMLKEDLSNAQNLAKVLDLIHSHPAASNPSGNVEIAQLVPLGYIGAAIVTHDNMARAQIEMIGYAKTDLWTPDEKTLDALSSLMNVLKEECEIPLSRPWPDGVFGMAGKTKHRNDGHFGKVSGWFAHGDCPTPDTHWDPGALIWGNIWKRCAELEQESKKVN